MKKYFVPVALLAIMAACTSSENKTEGGDTAAASTTTPAADDLNANPDYQKGLDLIATNDCLTCHKVEEKMTGPAYREVAAKYENNDANVKMLAGKIINGGSGVWGDIAMTPHPGLSQEDAEAMAKYILLLKK